MIPFNKFFSKKSNAKNEIFSYETIIIIKDSSTNDLVEAYFKDTQLDEAKQKLKENDSYKLYEVVHDPVQLEYALDYFNIPTYNYDDDEVATLNFRYEPETFYFMLNDYNIPYKLIEI